MPEVEEPQTYGDEELTYAAYSRCPCGAGLAYVTGAGINGPLSSWDCSDILTGRAIPSGQPGAKQHTDRLPFIFWEIKSELQPSANGATTRPKDAKPRNPQAPPSNLRLEVTIPRAEYEALKEMARDAELSLDAATRQAIRVYQLHRKHQAGEVECPICNPLPPFGCGGDS